MNQAASATMAPKITIDRIFRFFIFLLTWGYIYPHVCVEGMDLTKIDENHAAGKKD